MRWSRLRDHKGRGATSHDAITRGPTVVASSCCFANAAGVTFSPLTANKHAASFTDCDTFAPRASFGVCARVLFLKRGFSRAPNSTLAADFWLLLRFHPTSLLHFDALVSRGVSSVGAGRGGCAGPGRRGLGGGRVGGSAAGASRPHAPDHSEPPQWVVP